MLARLASWCYRHRRRVVAAWVLALVVGVGVGSAVGSEFHNSFSLPGTESQHATELLQSRFPSRAGDEGQVVVADTAGVTADQARIESLLAKVGHVAGVVGVVSPFSAEGAGQVSHDGTVAFATIQFGKLASSVPSSTLSAIRSLAEHARGHGLRVELGGRMFDRFSGVGPAELVGIAAAMLILLVAFGSLLAMGLPIMMALAGIGIGVGLVEIMTHVITTPDFAIQVASMIGIGVGIDYALFIVTRYRHFLHQGHDPEYSVVHAIDAAGRAVLFAGCTVVISMLGLFLMGVAFVQGLAVGTSLTVTVVMLASVTLLPAVLGFAGHAIDRLRIGGGRIEGASRHSLWWRWSRVVQRRPWPAFLAGLAILVLLGVPLLSMRMAMPDAGSNPQSDTTRQAYDLVARGFGPGFNGPLILAAELPPGTSTAPLDSLVAKLRAASDVAGVSAPHSSPAGDAAVVRVIPSSSPQSQETADLVRRLRDDVIPSAVSGTPVRVYVGGLTATSIDFSERLSARLPVFIGVVLLLSFLLLMAVFRSLLVPLKAVVMNLLSIGAAYGVVVAVFQWGWLAGVIGIDKTGPIAPFAPMLMFAILFGLSMDYEVFLLSRIREEYDHTHDNGLAVADGLATTARVITAAALIMVTVFGSFILSNASVLKLFGLGLASAILIDATVVRMVLVPATMELLGDRNWWFPRRLDRILPVLHVEPTSALDEELAELTAADELEHPPVG